VLFGCGAAFNIAFIPRTTFDTSLKSATLSFDLARPNSAPAPPVACSSVKEPIRSGFGDSRWRSLRHALVRGRAA
jgi:hypothetical protein